MKKAKQLAVGVGMLAGATLASCGSSGYETDAIDYYSPAEYIQTSNTNPEDFTDDSFRMNVYVGFIAVIATGPVMVIEVLKAIRRLDREDNHQNDRTA